MDFYLSGLPRLKTLLSLMTLPLLMHGCGVSQQQQQEPPPPQFVAASFTDFQGWNSSQAEGLRQALLKSCSVYTKRKGAVDKNNALFGTYEQWQPICAQLPNIAPQNLVSFFEKQFAVYQVSPDQTGLFTGYFTPLLHGSRSPSTRYSTPLLKVPSDLLEFNPADFGLKNIDDNRPARSLAAKISNNRLVPYDNRAAINQRIKNGDYKDDTLLWVDSRIDRFFLQIQGSGTVKLNTGEDVQVRFAGRNGHQYYAIGRYLKNKGLLQEVSMQSIRKWLEENPDRLDEVLHTNPDFIFFSELNRPGPLGAQGTQLIAEHSAAIDTRYIPLGTPLWLSTTLTQNNTPFNQAVVAQDVGSAIRGQVRADIFFGAGDEAADKAGYQNAGGKMYVMVPQAAQSAQP